MGSFWCFQADKMWNKRKEQNQAFIALHSWTLNDPFLCKKNQPFQLFLSSKKELLFSFLDDAIRIYGSNDTEVSAKTFLYSFRHNVSVQIIFKSLWNICQRFLRLGFIYHQFDFAILQTLRHIYGIMVFMQGEILHFT